MSKFLALYIGSATRATAAALSPEEVAKGQIAWGAWMGQNAHRIVDGGGPLGKTKKMSQGGIEDTTNTLTGYVIVEAETHEDAARMFENHPHFMIFPGDSVEVMVCPPIPGM